MKPYILLAHLWIFVFFCFQSVAQTISPNIKIDQFGYPVNARKIAFISNPINGYNNAQTFTPSSVYQVRNATTNAVVYSGMPAAWKGGALHGQSGDKVWWFDFSNLTTVGSYYVLDVGKNVRSYTFEINDNVYSNVLKAATKMFYYNRRGFAKTATYAGIWADANPAFNNANQDLQARLVTDKNNSATAKDVSGGWFDAGDYNKYTNFTFSVFSDMLLAYEEKPTAWTDDTNIPESGNGIPDLLDEIKWEMDWLLKMQNANGSVLSKVGNAAGTSMNALPPSAVTTTQYYGAASTSSTLTGAMAFALGAIQYKSLSNSTMQTYGNTLQTAAINAWNWAVANPSVLFVNAGSFDSADPEVDAYTRKGFQISAAAYLFALTGNTTYKTYFDANYESLSCVKASGSYTSLYEQHFQDAVLYYAKTVGATASVVTNIKNRLTSSVKFQPNNLPSFVNQDDAYRAYVTDADYNWGSSKIKSCAGNNLNNMIRYNLDASNNERYREATLTYLHYIHGTNATGFSFLTNMSSYGAENSVTKMYHAWFGASGSFSGNTPPGYLVGGVNKYYSPDGSYSGPVLAPPLNQPVAKAYKDWDTSWPENSWEITEPAIYYQASYIRLLSKGVGGVQAPVADIVNPTVPTNLASSNVTYNSFTLNWTASTDNIDVVAYEIYNNGVKIFESTSNTMNLTGLTENTTYNLTVKAKDRLGNLSNTSASLSVTTSSQSIVSDVIFSPLGGTFTTAQTVILNSNTAGASIRFTTDGSVPSATVGTVYTSPINISATTTIRAIAYKSGLTNSNVSSQTYTINIPNSSDQIIYDDALGGGWNNWSYTQCDFNNTQPEVKNGLKSIKAYPNAAWGGLYFHSDNVVNVSNYNRGIQFWAFGKTTNGTNTKVKIQVSNNSTPQKAIDLDVGVWTLVTVAWADLGSPSTTQDVVIQDRSGAGGQVFFIDDVKLLANIPIQSPVFETIKNGNWNDASVWFSGIIPSVSDDVTIKHTVTINSRVHAKKVNYSGGQINCEVGGDLQIGL